jgi:multidrug efflux pump subunit AcrA (membrane-fusion protein)
MKTQEVLMMETASYRLGTTIAACQLIAFVCLTLVFAGCKQPAPAPPEKTLVRTTEVESMENVRPDGEASYLAIIRAEKETDLSFKVAGILETIGPTPGTDWDEGTPVKAGAVLAELKQADFINSLNSARARADLAAFMPSPHHYSSPCRTRAQVALKKFYRSTAPKRQAFTGATFP